MEEKLYGCGECGTPVGDDEYVTNWGSRAPCFDRRYDAYVKREKRQGITRKLSAWLLATIIATALFAGVGKVIGIVLFRLSQMN